MPEEKSEKEGEKRDSRIRDTVRTALRAVRKRSSHHGAACSEGCSSGPYRTERCARACGIVVGHSEIVNLGGRWLEGHGVSVEPGLLGLSS